jgi:hypothetical protein
MFYVFVATAGGMLFMPVVETSSAKNTDCQNYWGSRLCPAFWEVDLFPSSGEGARHLF